MACEDIELTIEEQGSDIELTINEDASDINLTLSGDFSRFTSLLDTPNTYSGQALKGIRVNAGEDALEFFTGSGLVDWGEIGGTLSDQTDLQDALNLKYDSADYNTDWDTRLATKDTDDLSEGSSNLYDKTVVLTDGTGIAVTGTYPNFTITNTGEAMTLVAGNAIDITESPDDTFTIAVDESEISHTNISDIGSNTHAQIDTFMGTTVPGTYVPYSGATGDVDLGVYGMGLNDITLPETTSATTGIIFKGANSFLHDSSSTSSPTHRNIFLGMNAGNFTNESIKNVGIGKEALLSLTTGGQNMAIGAVSMKNLTTGGSNVAVGVETLYSTTTGGGNVGIGTQSLWNNEDGGGNVGIGTQVLYNLSAGNNNIAIGSQAGQLYGTELWDRINTCSESIFVGFNTKALLNNGSNEVVIGFEAQGHGSNTVTLGNDSVTNTYLKGEVDVGTHKITSVVDPTADQDVATKKFVDDQNLWEIYEPGFSIHPKTALSIYSAYSFQVGKSYLVDGKFGNYANSANDFEIKNSAGGSAGTTDKGIIFSSTSAPTTYDPLMRMDWQDGVQMFTTLDMNSNKITEVTDPTADQDAATKKFVVDADALLVPYTGATTDVDLGIKDISRNNYSLDTRAFYNGTFKEHFDALVTSNGTVITLTLTGSDTANLISQFSSGDEELIMPYTCTLTPGSDTIPQGNYVYILESDTSQMTCSTTGWPSAEHIKIGFFFVQSASYVEADGALINQNWNDGLSDGNGTGHVTHVGQWIRTQGATWFSGCAGEGSDGYIDLQNSDKEMYVKVGAGVISQMHQHNFTAKDTSLSTDDIHIVNHPTTPYLSTHDLGTVLVDSAGGSLSGKYYNIVIGAVANKGGEYGPVMCNLPGGSYGNVSDAINDVDSYDNYDMPREFSLESSTGFYLARITIKHKTGQNTFTIENEVDLRGRKEIGGVTGGGAGGTTTEFSDSQFKIFDNLDATKILQLDAGSITTGNTRTYVAPDADGTLALTSDLTPTSGDFGFWNRTGTVLAPKTSGDDIDEIGNINMAGKFTNVIPVDFGAGTADGFSNVATITEDLVDWAYLAPRLFENKIDLFADIGDGDFFPEVLRNQIQWIGDSKDEYAYIDGNILTNGFYREAASNENNDYPYYAVNALKNTISKGSGGEVNTIDWVSDMRALTNYITYSLDVQSGDFRADWYGQLNNVYVKIEDNTAGSFINRIKVSNNELQNYGDATEGYVVYAKMTGTEPTDEAWLFYADGTLGDNFLGGDGIFDYKGTAKDCGHKYDGSNWLFYSQLVGSGDFKFMDGSIYGVGGFKSSDGSAGITATIATTKLTPGGANGSMTFKNGLLTAQTAAT